MDEDYVEAVLTLVEQLPHGRVTTYGDLARAVGVSGPRQVGRVMALHGDAVPWWRVVHADGTPATCHDGTALGHLRGEGVPITNGRRVDMQVAVRLPRSDATTAAGIHAASCSATPAGVPKTGTGTARST